MAAPSMQPVYLPISGFIVLFDVQSGFAAANYNKPWSIFCHGTL
jgi:hypothetical protein